MDFSGGKILIRKYLTYEELYCPVKSFKTEWDKIKEIYMNLLSF